MSETADGTTSTVVVTVDGNNQTVTVPGATVVVVALTDTYTHAPGSLVVTKTIAGAAAGSQGPIEILVDCGGPPQVFGFLIPARTPAGPVPRAYNELAAGSTCTVTEVVDGSTSEVDVVGEGSGQSVDVPAGGTATADMKDTFTAVSPVTEASVSTTTTEPSSSSTVAPAATSASSGELPFTGVALSWIWAGATLIGLGLALQLFSRRRRR